MRPTAVEAGGRQAKQERSLYQHPPVLFTGNLHQSVNQTTRAGESRGAEDRPCLGPREAPSLIDLLPLAEGRRPVDAIEAPQHSASERPNELRNVCICGAHIIVDDNREQTPNF